MWLAKLGLVLFLGNHMNCSRTHCSCLVENKGLCEQSTGTEVYKEIDLNLVDS